MRSPVALLRLPVLALAAVLSLLACGGGSGGVDSGGTGSFASGPISGFGSVIVNGVHFDDAAAAVSDDDGTPRTRADLRLGMVVAIDASAIRAGAPPSATAQRIRLASEAVGPVQAIDAAGGTLVVLGQPVALTATTVFDDRLPGGVAALRAGDVVAVYGQRDLAGGGRIVATRLEPRSDAARFALRAPVATVDAAARRIGLGGLTVALPGGAVLPGVGDIVRVRLEPLPVGGVWIAVALDGAAPMPGEGREAEIAGRISAFTSVQRFSVDGVAVDAGAAAFPDGSAGVGLGARVEVEGRIAGGVLVAREVKLDGESGGGTEPFELDGTIDALDAAAHTFTLRGATVHWSDVTRFDDGTAADLAAGRRVEVRGMLSADGTRIEATRIKVGG